MRLTRHLAVALVVLAIGAATALFYFIGSGRPGYAPDLPYTRLDGSTARIGQLRGQVVLVNFWATSCAVCVKEMPRIAALHEAFKARGYETLAVAMPYDPPASVVNFAESRRLPFPVVIDNTGAIVQGFGGVEGTPTSVLINKRGEIVRRFVGEPDFALLRRLVDGLLSDT